MLLSFTRDDLDYLDGKKTVFGEVVEGLETLTRINEAYVDEKNRPYKNIRFVNLLSCLLFKLYNLTSVFLSCTNLHFCWLQN